MKSGNVVLTTFETLFPMIGIANSSSYVATIHLTRMIISIRTDGISTSMIISRLLHYTCVGFQEIIFDVLSGIC